MWRYIDDTDIISPNPWYVLLEMDFSSHLGLCLRCEIALRNPFLMRDCSQKSILDMRLLSEIHSWCKIALRNPFLMRDCSQKSILDARLLSEIHSWYEIALRNPFLQNKSTTVYTVKPVLRGHHWIKEKEWPFKTGDLLKEVQFIWNYLRQEKKKVTF